MLLCILEKDCMPDFIGYPLGKDGGTGKRGVLVGALLLLAGVAAAAAAAAILFFSCAEFQLGFHFSLSVGRSVCRGHRRTL